MEVAFWLDVNQEWGVVAFFSRTVKSGMFWEKMTCIEIMEYLMKNGANVNASNPDGQTVLMFAAGKKKS